MIYLLRSSECEGFNKSRIQDAIKDSKIYKNFRWAYINTEIKETKESLQQIRGPILKLNETKTEIIEVFKTMKLAAADINTGKLSIRDIINNNEKYNSFYYIEYTKCSKDLIEKYNKPIHNKNHIHAQKVKQINPISKTSIIFNNYNEIYIKLRIASKTIINAINNKTIYCGSLWEYCE